MSGLRPVENEKYIPKFVKHKYVPITSSADQIAATQATTLPAKKPTVATKEEKKNV